MSAQVIRRHNRKRAAIRLAVASATNAANAGGAVAAVGPTPAAS